MMRIISPKNLKEISQLLKRLRVDDVGIGFMLPKTHHYLIYLNALNVPAANILKQELLSVGGDVALDKGACNFSVRETPCLMMGTFRQFQKLSKKLSAQPFGLKAVGKEIRDVLENSLGVPPPIKAGPHVLNFSKSPLIMGIINVTPDSFSGDGIGGHSADMILRKAENLLHEGADILDIGGESTRPGAAPVSFEEEKTRMVPAIKAIVKRFNVPVSIDTTKAEIAKQCLDLGAHIINDVSGLLSDKNMVSVACRFDAPVVVMHHRFSKKPKLKSDLLTDIGHFFQERLAVLSKAGISTHKIILDPGIGFGKTPEQNLFVLKRIAEFKGLGKPLLLGASRKSFIGKVLENTVEERSIGTAASLVYGYLNGVHLFRVHDVREAREALAMSKAILEASDG